MSTSNSQHNANDLETLKAWRSRAGTWLQIASGLGLMAGWLLIAQAGLLASIVNDVVFNEVALAQLIPLLLAMLGIFALRAALAWGSEQAALQGATQVKLAVRMQLYRHVQQLGPAWLRSERSGEVVNTLSDGVEALEAYYARYVPTMTLVVWLPLSIVVFVFANDWVSGLIMLLTAPLIPLFMMLIGKGTEQLNQTQWQTLARLSAHFLDTLQGLTTLKLFNASRREAAVIARISDEYRQRRYCVLPFYPLLCWSFLPV